MNKKIFKKKDMSSKEMINQLIENNMMLQKRNVELLQAVNELTKKTSMLNDKIENLVNIFEEAAKNVADIEEDRRVKELALKLDDLLDQNKNLANGLLLLERYVRSKSLETKRL